MVVKIIALRIVDKDHLYGVTGILSIKELNVLRKKLG